VNRRFVAAAMIALQNTPEASTSPPDRPRHNRLFAAPGPNEPTNHPFFSSLLVLADKIKALFDEHRPSRMPF